MKPFNIKSSISRKALHRLSVRQRSKVMSEIRSNLRLQNYCNCSNATEKPDNIQNIQDGSGPSTSMYTSTNVNSINNISNIAYDTEDNTSSSSSCVSEISNIVSLSVDISNEPSFSERLPSCFVHNNLTHVQCNSILSLLRTHPCFSSLPKDARTLLRTPQNRVIVYKVEPGEYIHFDLERKLVESLENASFVTVGELVLDFSTDGCNLDKAGTVHIWPIQCRIVNIQYTKPIVIGIYKGAQKPYDPNVFCEKFVTDIKAIISNGGINYNNIKIPIRLRCFIADAPARAFILNHRSHMSSQPCSKCKVSGTYIEGRFVFTGINHSVRTDEEYIRCFDEDHHKEGTSPLLLLPINMVSQVPFEYMHLVCLGVMKKILSAWVYGKYSRLSKLSGRSISLISARSDILRKYCPSEFARRPRSLDLYSKYKATEFRQFLLYSGPVVTYGLLDEQLYKHFLFLHAALRVLVSNSPSRQQFSFAELALQKFVLRCEHLYGPTFNTYNVHGLLHLIDDVRHLGSLDSYSAFPYENNMSTFRKYCRKPGLPLQQFFNRITEIQSFGTSTKHNVDSFICASMHRCITMILIVLSIVMFNLIT